MFACILSNTPRSWFSNHFSYRRRRDDAYAKAHSYSIKPQARAQPRLIGISKWIRIVCENCKYVNCKANRKTAHVNKFSLSSIMYATFCDFNEEEGNCVVGFFNAHNTMRMMYYGMFNILKSVYLYWVNEAYSLTIELFLCLWLPNRTWIISICLHAFCEANGRCASGYTYYVITVPCELFSSIRPQRRQTT